MSVVITILLRSDITVTNISQNLPPHHGANTAGIDRPMIWRNFVTVTLDIWSFAHPCVCHMLIHYLHCCTELKFTVRKLLFNVLCVFTLRRQGYNCGKFHLNRFRNVLDCKNKGDVFFRTIIVNSSNLHKINSVSLIAALQRGEILCGG